MPDKLRAAFLRKTYALAEKLKSKVHQNLTNRILNIRTGKLVRSIFEDVTNSTNEVSGRVYSSIPAAFLMHAFRNSAAIPSWISVKN